MNVSIHRSPLLPAMRSKMVRAAALAVVLGLVVSLGIAPAARADTDPMAVVKGLVNHALSILGNKQMPLATKRTHLKALVSDNFDFSEMSRSALGYHWRTITPAQRHDFTTLFTEFIQASYLNKIQDYQGQTVKFLKWSMDSPGYAEVDTRVIQSNGGQPVPVHYRLKLENGQWKIYDVTVDAISIIANYRNQFNRVINDKGFPKLMADLRDKRNQLQNSLGQPTG